MHGRPSAKAKAASSKVSGTTVMQTPDQRTAPKISYRKRSPKSVAPKAPVAEPTTQANRSMDTISSKGHRPHAPPTHGALRQHHNGGHPRRNPFDTAERRESAGRAASVRLLVHVNARRPATEPTENRGACREQARQAGGQRREGAPRAGAAPLATARPPQNAGRARERAPPVAGLQGHDARSSAVERAHERRGPSTVSQTMRRRPFGDARRLAPRRRRAPTRSGPGTRRGPQGTSPAGLSRRETKSALRERDALPSRSLALQYSRRRRA